MKKRIVKIIVSVLTCALLGACFAGCGSQGKTLMVLEQDGIRVKLSLPVFQLYLSRLKGQMATADDPGSDALSDSYWDAWVSQDGTTRNEKYTNYILEEAKTYLAALYLFEKNGLKLPDSTVEAVEEELAELMEYRANGSKAEFNSQLLEFGVNYKNLREAMLISEKISYLKNYLFGANGSLIAENLVNEYYQQTYRRFKIITLYTSEYVYYTDGDGKDIYYTDQTYQKIAYDTTAVKKIDTNGTAVTDSNGDQVYVKQDEEGNTLIAYDTKNGVRRNQTDEQGRAIVRSYDKSSAEYKSVIDQAEQIKALVTEQDFEGFDALVTKYNQSTDMETYPGGYYVTASSNFESAEVIQKLFQMEVGKMDTATSTYGIHIFMRYELEDKGYEKSQNEAFFQDVNTGTNLMIQNLKDRLLADHLSALTGSVIVDTAVLSEADIKRIGANTWC